jgi:hypothetical protein
MAFKGAVGVTLRNFSPFSLFAPVRISGGRCPQIIKQEGTEGTERRRFSSGGA